MRFTLIQLVYHTGPEDVDNVIKGVLSKTVSGRKQQEGFVM